MPTHGWRPRAAGLWLLAAVALAGSAAQAQDYPTNPVKLVTQGAPGSGPDVIARIVADHLGRLWGQQVLVLSHPGAAGSAAARVAAAAAPDGSTLYMPATSAFVVMPEMLPNLPFDLERTIRHKQYQRHGVANLRPRPL